MRTNLTRQRGAAALVALLVALVLAGGFVSAAVAFAQRQQQITFAEIEGQALSQFAVGLRGFVAAAQNDPTLLPSNPWTVNGVAWLRPSTCGGRATNPPEGYVPCNYTGQTLGAQYSTRLTRNTTTNEIEARVSVRAPILGGAPRSRIITAERMVEAALSQQSLPANGMFYTAFANGPLLANPPVPLVPAAVDEGWVRLVVNNAPSNDIFLRVDGTNQMRANLNFGGFSVRNARDARFTGDVRVENRMQVDQGITVTQGVTDMRGGAIVGDRTVNNGAGLLLDNIGRYAETGIYQVELLTGSMSHFVAAPDCTRFGNAPAIYTVMQSTGSPNFDGVYRADAMYDSRIDVTPTGSGWNIVPVLRATRFGLQQTGPNVTLTRALEEVNPADSRIIVMTRCR